MKFTKMHGAGNDFIILDDRRGELGEDYSLLARRFCRRRLSLGADGVMVVTEPKNGGDLAMVFLNSDGTLGEMCGNGARCITRWALEHGLGDGEKARIETTAGIVEGRRVTESEFTVRLNDPTKIIPEMTVQGRSVTYVELGNPSIPHCIVFSGDYERLNDDELRALGRSLRHDAAFPKGANVTFVSMGGEIRCVTFERGVEDFTLACGTGAGSTALALRLRGLAGEREVSLRFPGGVLRVDVEKDGDGWELFLTGPTCVVAEGEIFEEN